MINQQLFKVLIGLVLVAVSAWQAQACCFCAGNKDPSIEKYLLFLNNAGHSVAHAQALDWLQAEVEMHESEAPEMIMELLKTKARFLDSAREAREHGSPVIPGGFPVELLDELAYIIQGYLNLEQSASERDCSVGPIGGFLVLLSKDYGGPQHLSGLHNDDGHQLQQHHGKINHQADHCSRKFIQFAKHYGAQHVSQCLNHLHGRFLNGYIRTNWELEGVLDAAFSDDEDGTLSDTVLAQNLRDFSFLSSSFDAEHMYRAFDEDWMDSEDESNKFKASRIQSTLVNTCIKLRTRVSDIFDIYNVARAIDLEATEAQLSSLMHSNLDHFRKANEYNRLCMEILNSDLNEKIGHNINRNFNLVTRVFNSIRHL